MAAWSAPGDGDLKAAGCSTGGRAYFGPTKQPATATLATVSAMRRRRPDRGIGEPIIGPLAAGRSGRARSHDLPLLQRHRRLLHDRFAALQAGLHVDRIPEIAAQHYRLKMQ